MGKINPKDRTIKSQFITSFYKVLLLSIVATLITWGLVVGLIMVLQNKINPANYYERQIPDILAYVAENQEDMLSINAKDKLERVIPLEGMDYQILDTDGEILYGSFTKKYIGNKKELNKKLNTHLYDKQYFIQYYPILDAHTDTIGAIGLRYQLNLSASNPQTSSWIWFLIGIIVFISPFAYFVLFSYLSGRRLSRTIEEPFNHLIDNAKRIQKQDLDFPLPDMEYSKEFRQVVLAFEEMRVSLKASLGRQIQLEQERKDMVAAISHDMRTPLTIIQGHAEGLLEGKDHREDRLERYLQTIISNVNHSIRLIDDLNMVSKVEQTDFSLQPSAVNIMQFVQMKSQEYTMLCYKENITFKHAFHNESQRDSVMNIDASRITQVLDNMIVNSIRFTPENGVITWVAKIEDHMLIFQITDSGPGFSHITKQRLFDKFYHEGETRVKHGGHTGLGLYIAQTIVKKHGGKISAYNHPNGGAFMDVEIQELKD